MLLSLLFIIIIIIWCNDYITRDIWHSRCLVFHSLIHFLQFCGLFYLVFIIYKSSICITSLQYDKLNRLVRDFDPFKNLWITISDWLKWHESWMTDPLTTIDSEQCDKQVNDSFMTIHKCVKIFKDIPGRCSCRVVGLSRGANHSVFFLQMTVLCFFFIKYAFLI